MRMRSQQEPMSFVPRSAQLRRVSQQARFNKLQRDTAHASARAFRYRQSTHSLRPVTRFCSLSIMRQYHHSAFTSPIKTSTVFCPFRKPSATTQSIYSASPRSDTGFAHASSTNQDPEVHIDMTERYTDRLTHQSIRTPHRVCRVHRLEINTGITEK